MDRNETNIVLAERIGKLRVLAGESQQSLADNIGVKRETVKFWESGERHIKCGDIAKLAKHFNVSADYLLGLSDVASPDTDIRSVCDFTGLSEEAVEYIRNFGFILLKDGYFEAARGFRHAIMQTLNLLLESDEFVDIMLNLQRSRDIYRLTPDPEARGIDLINAEDMAVKVGFVILDRLEAAEHYAQKASLALHEFSTKTLRQFAEAEKEAATNE